MPDLEDECDNFHPQNPCPGRQQLITWTVGAGGWDSPAVAGFPLGPSEASHMYLEMHYGKTKKKKIHVQIKFALGHLVHWGLWTRVCVMLGHSPRLKPLDHFVLFSNVDFFF